MRTALTKSDTKTEQKTPDTAVPTEQSLTEQIVKFIPAEVLAFYLPALAAVAGLKSTTGVITTEYTNWLWITFAAGIIAAFIYTLRNARNDLKEHNVPNPNMRGTVKAGISSFAFFTWALYLGGPFESSSGTTIQPFNVVLGTLLILLFTLANPFIYNFFPFPNSSSDLSIEEPKYAQTEEENVGKLKSIIVRNHTNKDIKLANIALYWQKNILQRKVADSRTYEKTVTVGEDLKIEEELRCRDCKSKLHYVEIQTANGIIIKSPMFNAQVAPKEETPKQGNSGTNGTNAPKTETHQEMA
jgi:hypothetical protein